MKKLTLVRHAKSSWKYNLPDHLRPLNARGISDAELVSKHVNKLGFSADYLLSSNAVRAQATAEIFIEELQIPSSICQFSHELYDFSGEHLVFNIKNCPNHINNLLVFGHNDAITHFVNKYGSESIQNVPTCGLVTITFHVKSWNDIEKGTTHTIIFPKDLKI